ncbi:MAG: hypothetical protein ACRCU1_18590 [Alsobacter sp.]
MTNTNKLTGHAAIAHAGATGATLNKYADPTEGARSGLTVEEAEDVAREDASLIWCEAWHTEGQ